MTKFGKLELGKPLGVGCCHQPGSMSGIQRWRAHRRRCMGKDCTNQIKHSTQLDVHHLDPIAEGVRETTLDDLVVLYANCHRLAHHLMRNGSTLEINRN